MGETLTADTSGIADADGLTNVSFSYQWIRSDGNTDTDIAGGTSSTYTLVSADVGQTIKVQVSFTDDRNNAETLTSEATAAVAAAPNRTATGLPTISGTAQVDETLTASTSDIEDQDGLDNATFTYQWLADDSVITDATGSAYTLVAGDQGRSIKARVSFIDNADNEETLTSAATAAVAARPNSPATGAPTISGTAQVGETLTTSTSDIEDADGLTGAAFSYQWISSDTKIEGATEPTYTLAAADQGRTVRVRVSFIDDEGNAESLTSAATDTVEAAPVTTPLTASFQNVPASHDGESAFTFSLTFSEDVDSLSFQTLRDEALEVTGGEVLKAKRRTKGSNQE